MSPIDERKGRGTPVTRAEINVTPMVDVMMVLLVIFMVATPLLQQGVEVVLAKAGGDGVALDRLVIRIDNLEQVSVAGQPVDRGMLRDHLARQHARNPDQEVFVRADREVGYGFVAKVLAEVTAAEFTRIGMMARWDPDVRL